MTANEISAFCLLAILTPACGQSGSYSLTGIVTQTVGTTAMITGSGSRENTNIWNAGNVGRFIVADTLGATYGLQVSALNPTGTLSVGQDSLMAARTVNSQGLEDDGTLSVYVAPGASGNPSGNWTLDLKFSFFDAAFTAPANLDLMLTSLDIDYNQRYYTQTADFSSNSAYSPSNITAAAAISGYSGFTAAGDSVFSNPAHAVSSTGFGSEFDVKIAHNSVALYMFEFRNPSRVLAPPALVPEPTVQSSLAGVGGLVLMRRRRERTPSCGCK